MRTCELAGTYDSWNFGPDMRISNLGVRHSSGVVANTKKEQEPSVTGDSYRGPTVGLVVL